jgi:hypothetical protein
MPALKKAVGKGSACRIEPQSKIPKILSGKSSLFSASYALCFRVE